MLTRCVEMSRVSLCLNFEVMMYTVSVQEKSAQYWPESLNECITPGDRVSVTLLSSTPFAEYHIRKFMINHVSDLHNMVEKIPDS